MDYIVYIADECRDEAKAHNYTDALEKQARDIEQKQKVAFNPFPAPFFVKKKFGDKRGRLIAAQEIVNINGTEYAVIKFLAVFIKADKEYDDFQDNSKVYGDKYLRRVGSDQLKSIVAERIKEAPPQKKQALSNEEEAFLYDSKTTYSLENESLVYESENWIKSINANPYKNYIADINRTLSKLVDDVKKDRVEKDKHSVAIADSQNYHIVYFAGDENNYVFLVGLCSTREEIDKTVEQWEKRFESADITKLARLARRAYPDYLIYAPEFWFELEKDTQSNFALSGEEINVLKSISEQSSFPLFVNGRAGSGKSTILQYIFAEYFFRYLSYQDAVPPPVYFTYNYELL